MNIHTTKFGGCSKSKASHLYKQRPQQIQGAKWQLDGASFQLQNTYFSVFTHTEPKKVLMIECKHLDLLFSWLMLMTGGGIITTNNNTKNNNNCNTTTTNV